MKIHLTSLLAVLLLSAPAGALSGRAAFVFQSAVKAARLKVVPCPGKLGNASTRCATSSAERRVTQKKLSGWKGWKQTDTWVKDSASFTSNGTDAYILSVLPKIGSSKGSLLIFSEF